ncbi:MAG: hypothetical protein EON59_16535 [Alphaproteobacteria bacterium]|nr:MAG: hypothetical protein EON59_16535 [Alphaproteobacteria bacterium]
MNGSKRRSIAPDRPSGAVERRVLHKQTYQTPLEPHQIRASWREPDYIRRSDNGGKALFWPSALTKIGIRHRLSDRRGEE